MVLEPMELKEVFDLKVLDNTDDLLERWEGAGDIVRSMDVLVCAGIKGRDGTEG